MAVTKAYCKPVKRPNLLAAGMAMTMEFTLTPPPDSYQVKSVSFATAMERFMHEAPYLARCSDNKTAALVRPREHAAAHFPYMQINRRDMVSWLIFDLDHVNALSWDDAGLPAPNLIVRNRKNGHAHLYYAISPICTSEKARERPVRYMKAVYAAFAERLQADEDYHSGPVAKTPGHPWWQTTELHAHVYDLGELAESVELKLPTWRKGPDVDQVSHSRHCIMFEKLRHFAYSITNRERDRGTFQSFTRQLEQYAHSENRFARAGFTSRDLPLSSIRATVRSVARWCWYRYTGSGRVRGSMELDPSLPLAERQKQAAERTHGVRRKATEAKIRAACVGLLERGEAITQAAVARLAQLSRQTVGKYQHVLVDVQQPKKITVLAEVRQAKAEGVQGQAASVKHGAHQITARIGGAVDPAVPALNSQSPAVPRGVECGDDQVLPPDSDQVKRNEQATDRIGVVSDGRSDQDGR